MIKICSIAFVNHPILGNLELDFCDQAGNPVDTVLIAGENGTGKSTVLDCLYTLVARDGDHEHFEAYVIYDINGTKRQYHYYSEPLGNRQEMYAQSDTGNKWLIYSSELANEIPTSGIYSDVDIVFNAQPASTVTSMNLDEIPRSRKSNEGQSTMVNQLIVDVQALDDAVISQAVRENPNQTFSNLIVEARMDRFTNAFSIMFDQLRYSHIDTHDGDKDVIFNKDGVDISLSKLSSGEKQIVYRGCFLLKDVQAMKGAFVFIDEPETSLHPLWQEKIMDYYKAIFTDNAGCQTSQIFAVTHSPFVIHSNTRQNDKVIVLTRNGKGRIAAIDKPIYYKCGAEEAIEDAFSIANFNAQPQIAYVAGRTDEKYLNTALGIFIGESAVYQFKWIGYIDTKGQERNTGDSCLAKVEEFLVGQNYKTACLYDCDTNRKETTRNNCHSIVLPKFDNEKQIRKGIENALVLDSIDLTPFYHKHESVGDYGGHKTSDELEKMKLCNYICSMKDNELAEVFKNLKPTLIELDSYFQK